MSVKWGLKVDPWDLATFIFLRREDVGDKMVPIEEPPPPENIQDVEDRGGVSLLNPWGGRAVGTGDRRGRRSQLHLLVRKREDGRG
jgi:hypothetical protein